MNLTFLGTDACMISAYNDSSGILINGKYLIDTGYFLVGSLKRLNIDPCSIEQLFFTHMHHDHYMALPQLIFWYLQNGKPLDKLQIFGPKNDLKRVVDLTMAFLQAGKGQAFYQDCSYPTLHELAGGEKFELDDMIISTCQSFHPIDGLCYRFEEKSTGKVVSLTGDTFYKEHIPIALRGCDILVHETALADAKSDINKPPSYLHSNIDISLISAREARAKKLFIHHFPALKAEAVINKAAKLSDIEVIYPELLKTYEV
jgi:ribonuclease Z